MTCTILCFGCGVPISCLGLGVSGCMYFPETIPAPHPVIYSRLDTGTSDGNALLRNRDTIISVAIGLTIQHGTANRFSYLNRVICFVRFMGSAFAGRS